MEEIPDHNHCRVCGKSVPVGKKTCSKECASKRAAALKQKQMLTYLMYGTAFFLVLLLVFAFHL